jgi:glycine/D-amino acid oxidase-like deaminating enzyme
MAEIVVLGAGVLGMTTAVVLRVAGHSVAIFAEKRIGDSGSDKDPWFASAYPAASIIQIPSGPFG